MPFLGEIKLHAGIFAPENWAFCQGQELSLTSGPYMDQALFSVIGIQFGGNGTTTFNLPDLRGRTPIGAGTGPGLTPRVQGQYGGVQGVTLLQNEMPAHNHVVTSTPTVTNDLTVTESGTIKCSSTGGNTVDPSNAFLAEAKAIGGDKIYTTDTSKVVSTMNSDALDINVNLAGNIDVAVSSVCQNTGSGLAHENMQPWLCLNYIICVSGLYPTRWPAEEKTEK